ncbi:hypothetical protein ACLESD_50385, partial [Pyxidicoccus sp. 3LFB2]
EDAASGHFGVSVSNYRLELEPGAGPAQVDAAAAVLLAALVSTGLPVCAFSARERNLEDAFMTVTKGRVA